MQQNWLMRVIWLKQQKFVKHIYTIMVLIAEAYFLLALVREATGNRAQAVDYLKKVIYLHPNHHEAMLHLASLLELLGDIEGAKSIQKRATRIRDKTG